MTEDQLEQEALGWLADVGYQVVYGPDVAPDGPSPERENYRQAILSGRLRTAIDRLNPGVPGAAREDALKQVLDLSIPALLSANRRFHQLLVTGVPVQYQRDGETRGDFVRLPYKRASSSRHSSSNLASRSTCAWLCSGNAACPFMTPACYGRTLSRLKLSSSPCSLTA